MNSHYLKKHIRRPRASKFITRPTRITSLTMSKFFMILIVSLMGNSTCTSTGRLTAPPARMIWKCGLRSVAQRVTLLVTAKVQATWTVIDSSRHWAVSFKLQDSNSNTPPRRGVFFLTSKRRRGGAGPLDETWYHSNSNSNIPDYCYLVKLYLLFSGLLFTI